MRRKLALRKIKFTIQSYKLQLVSHGDRDADPDCDRVRMESACNSGTSQPKLLHQLTGSSSSTLKSAASLEKRPLFSR